MEDTPTGLQQAVRFVGNGDLYTETLLFCDISHNLVRKMMDIDDNIVYTCIFQTAYDMLEERLATDRHKCFWESVGNGFQAGS